MDTGCISVVLGAYGTRHRRILACWVQTVLRSYTPCLLGAVTKAKASYELVCRGSGDGDCRPPALADESGRIRVLHLRPHQQRGRIPVPVNDSRLRHQQHARLLEHVPRILGHRTDGNQRHRQGLGLCHRSRTRRSHSHRRTNPAPTTPACFRHWRRRKRTVPK